MKIVIRSVRKQASYR
ncbi:hypothetical protein CAEBREN_01273 [Caenorhabditis brenneri]|uniref:Uncharacterized protein n=1 Tax=Caenorhabditis brenneri TaxID=135651 RepID=G0MG97_CAEBE|nr:hypothetical protein CAEBREN_01273 [Caenorhabditis brenneri]